LNFLADECCDAGLVAALRADGHDVLFAVEDLRGSSDEELLRRAFTEDRILLTEDKDFGELVFRLRQPAHGIVLLRFGIDERHDKVPRMRFLLQRQAHQLTGKFVVLESERVRLRPLRN
jgi:predicted nuclease of predicted toxin-antitoxin system